MQNLDKLFLAKGYSQKSTISYVKWIKELLKFCSKEDPKAITYPEIEDFVYRYLGKRKNLKSQSINNAISAFKVYYEKILGVDVGLSKLERPKRDSITAHYLEKNEIVRIINDIGNIKHKLIVTLLYVCALDTSIVTLIRLEDIDFAEKSIMIRNTKGKLTRKATLGKFELELLHKYLDKYKPQVYLFENYEPGKQYASRSVQHIVAKIGSNMVTDKTITSRSFKYSYVQHLTELGFPLKNILEHIGHSEHKNYNLYGEVTYNPNLSIDKSPLDIISKFSYDDRASELLLRANENIRDVSFIYDSPYLSDEDLDVAVEMSKMYLIIYCYENSTRKFIRQILLRELGNDWWNRTATSDMKNRVSAKQMRERNKKWLSSRDNSEDPLFYLDWSDLVKIFRKHEQIFKPYISDLKFVELRLEEMERTRNIIAHNGKLSSVDEYKRLVLYYKDWIKQIL